MRRPGAALAARDLPPGTAAVLTVVTAVLLLLSSGAAQAAGAASHDRAAAPADGAHYAVRPGESLTTISRGMAANCGMPQAAVEQALRKANPKAFIGGNANRLRTDVVLTVPPALQKNTPMPPQASEAVLAPPETRSADISSVAAAVSAMLGPGEEQGGPEEQNSAGAASATPASASTPASMVSASETASQSALQPPTQATAVQAGAVSSATARLEASAAAAPVSAAAGGGAAGTGSTQPGSVSTATSSASAASAPSASASAPALAPALAPRPAAAAQLRWVIPLLVVLGLFLAWFSRRRWANPPPLPAGSSRKRPDASDGGAAPGTPPRPADLSGKEAGRREVEALDVLRETSFSDREEAALHVQLSRAPRDVGALFGLLQLHARRGERAKVASFAHALWDETDADGELWRRAAAIGRSIDPDNPLYSEDPFTALAEHAAKQPVRAALPIGALDLSLPDSIGAADSDAVQTVNDDATPLRAAEGDVISENAAAAEPGGKQDLFRTSPALPASFDGLDLNLDGGAAKTPSTPEAGRKPGRTGGSGGSGGSGKAGE